MSQQGYPYGVRPCMRSVAARPHIQCNPIRWCPGSLQAAGAIHTDFERGFICAEVMHYEELHELGTEAAVKAAGKYRQEVRAPNCHAMHCVCQDVLTLSVPCCNCRALQACMRRASRLIPHMAAEDQQHGMSGRLLRQVQTVLYPLHNMH